MPFVAERPLEDMINLAAVDRAGVAMTGKGGERLAEVTRSLTPIYRGSRPEGHGRERGTARRSIRTDVVRRHTSPLGRGWRRRVLTDDPVFPYIEWDTRPHDIPNAFGFGIDFGIGGRFDGKFHPGTTGQHPFARAALIVALEVSGMFALELEEFGRDLTAARGRRGLDEALRRAGS